MLRIKGFILHIPEYQDIESAPQVKCIRPVSIRKIGLISRNYLAGFCTKGFKLVICLHQENILVLCFNGYWLPAIG